MSIDANVNVCNTSTKSLIFQPAETNTTGDGIPALITGKTTVMVSIYATIGTTFTVNFYDSTDGAIYLPVSGANTNGITLATSSSQTAVTANDKSGTIYGEHWQFSLAGDSNLIMHISTISGGTLTITGNAVLGG